MFQYIYIDFIGTFKAPVKIQIQNGNEHWYGAERDSVYECILNHPKVVDNFFQHVKH